MKRTANRFQQLCDLWQVLLHIDAEYIGKKRGQKAYKARLLCEKRMKSYSGMFKLADFMRLKHDH